MAHLATIDASAGQRAHTVNCWSLGNDQFNWQRQCKWAQQRWTCWLTIISLHTPAVTLNLISALKSQLDNWFSSWRANNIRVCAQWLQSSIRPFSFPSWSFFCFTLFCFWTMHHQLFGCAVKWHIQIQLVIRMVRRWESDALAGRRLTRSESRRANDCRLHIGHTDDERLIDSPHR